MLVYSNLTQSHVQNLSLTKVNSAKWRASIYTLVFTCTVHARVVVSSLSGDLHMYMSIHNTHSRFLGAPKLEILNVESTKVHVCFMIFLCSHVSACILLL